MCVPRVFRAPEAPAVGPGRCVCRWAAARWAGPLCVPVGGGPPARRPRREPAARRVASKPGQAPPPPTGTTARPSGPSGALHTSGAWSLIGASSRSPARPRAPAAEPTPNFACNSVATLKSTAPLLTAHHFRPFRARFSLAEASPLSPHHPHPSKDVVGFTKVPQSPGTSTSSFTTRRVECSERKKYRPGTARERTLTGRMKEKSPLLIENRQK